MENPDLASQVAEAAKTLGDLVKLHLALAKAEIIEEGRQEIGAAAGMAIAGAFGFVGLLGILITGIALWAFVLPVWGSALLMSGIFIVFATAFAAIGWRLHVRRPGRRLRETLTEDVQQLEEAVESQRPVGSA